MWDIFEWMIKAPLRMALWAVGSSWHPGEFMNQQYNLMPALVLLTKLAACAGISRVATGGHPINTHVHYDGVAGNGSVK
jgi:hypothetical protein